MNTDLRELNGIARNLANQVLDGTYSINEAVLEVMPFEYNLSLEERHFVKCQVETFTDQLVLVE